MNKRLLIVEDKPEELSVAIKSAKQIGFEDIVVASTLEEALAYLPKVNAVATDLFFPNGNVNTDEYTQRILPLYVSFAQSHFKLPQGDSNLLEAIKSGAELRNLDLTTHMDNLVKSGLLFQRHVEAARAALPNYAQTFDIKYFLKDEKDLPVGILVTEEAQKYNVPSVIVTSGGGHGGLLQPIMSLVTVPHVFNMQGDHKEWDKGLAKLLESHN